MEFMELYCVIYFSVFFIYCYVYELFVMLCRRGLFFFVVGWFFILCIFYSCFYG